MSMTRRQAIAITAAGLGAAMNLSPRSLLADNDAKPTSDLIGGVYCGYQGWFRTPGDGSHTGWVHYGGRHFAPGRCSIDLWPDVSELDDDEKYRTDFQHSDGSPAFVFSSHNRKTIDRHFKWMADYGIDGVFMQRFAGLIGSRLEASSNDILAWAAEAARSHRRRISVMYDLTGLRRGQVSRIIDDWAMLRAKLPIADRAVSVHHDDRPLVTIWGVGFNDGRDYTIDECRRLVSHLQSDAGGRCAVMLGVPYYWRKLHVDAVADPALHEIIRAADVVSPWSVGRYARLEDVGGAVRRHWEQDLAWCRDTGRHYMPVAFPGFSWHNLMHGRGRQSPVDQIPRRGGEFFWRQFVAAKQAGADTVYVAMFDELDEGTAILKCTSNPPVGESPFVSYGDVPPDHYLWLAGEGRRVMRGERPADEAMPTLRTS